MFEFLRKLFRLPKRLISPRVYHFPLPYKIEAMYLFYGAQQLKQAGIFQKLPKDLQGKWQKAADAWHSIRVTKEDLDRIDDVSWAAIASKLNLQWSKE